MSVIRALCTSDLNPEEVDALNVFLRGERLGVDDVFIYRESGDALVSYYSPSGSPETFNLTTGVDL